MDPVSVPKIDSKIGDDPLYLAITIYLNHSFAKNSKFYSVLPLSG